MKKLILILCLFFLCQCGPSDSTKSSRNCKKCSDFKTQKQVKNYLANHPECKKQFDHDRDGKPCESVPN